MEKVLLLTKVIYDYLIEGELSPHLIYEMNKNIDNYYTIATKNKIDLLFFKIIAEYGELKGHYKEIFEKRINERKEMIITAERIIKILEENGYKAATFKSFPLFPIVPNDIDVIILDDISNKEFLKIVSMLKNEYGYYIFDRIPYAVTLHDSRKGPHIDPRYKDPYDIDLYLEIAANKIIYFNKRFIIKRVKQIYVEDYKIRTLEPSIELLIQCIHAIIPEQIYLLYHFFVITTYMYYDHIYNISELKETYKLGKEIDLCLEITKGILDYIITHRSKYNQRVEEFFIKGYYRVKITELLSIIYQRILRDPLFKRSIIDQLYELSKSSSLTHVLKNLIERRTRETY